MRALLIALLASPLAASAQYLYPTPEENRSEPGLYVEDPFIVEYRKKFFAVFRGDLQTFSKAFDEVSQMVERDPSDARALVWRGNGKMVKGGIALFQNDMETARGLLAGSLADLDAAVALSPEDPNIYMMRAATLLLIHQRFPEGWSARPLYERLERDALKFLGHIGWRRLPRTSIHLRGEALASLAIAQRELEKFEESLVSWRRLEMLNRGTRYEAKAREDAEQTRQRRDQARSADPTGR
jgi:cytochrome c556